MDRSEWVLVLEQLNAFLQNHEHGDECPFWLMAGTDLDCTCGLQEARTLAANTLAAAPPPPADSEDAKAFQDMLDTGTGFMLDGKRIAPERVRVVTPPPAEQASGEWVVLKPDGTEACRDRSMALALARLQGYKLTIEGLLGLEEAGWRVLPVVALSQRPVVGEAERDRDRLDYIEREGISVSCQWKNTGWAGGPKWQAYVYGTGGKVFADGDTLRATIDALAPQQPTGEEG